MPLDKLIYVLRNIPTNPNSNTCELKFEDKEDFSLQLLSAVIYFERISSFLKMPGCNTINHKQSVQRYANLTHDCCPVSFIHTFEDRHSDSPSLCVFFLIKLIILSNPLCVVAIPTEYTQSYCSVTRLQWKIVQI